MVGSRRGQRVLIHRLGSLGDTLVAIPVFRLVRTAFRDARITVLTNHAHSDHAKSVGMRALLDGSDLVDDYLYYPVALRDPGELLLLRNRIARERFDTVVYVSSPASTAVKVVRDALFFLACGIRRQYGVPYGRSSRLNARIAGSELYQSESERLVSNVRRLGPADLRDDRWWDLGLSADEHRQASGYLAGSIDPSQFFAISIGTKADANDWTQANWVSFVRAMNERYSIHGLVAFGSADEFERSEALLGNWSGPRLNLCGRPSPRVSAA